MLISNYPNKTKALNQMPSMKKTLLFLSLSSVLIACSSTRYTVLEKKINSSLEGSFFENQFVGLMVYDPETRDTLYTINGQKYFTPASNTKIFTLYTALTLLPERIPALKYIALRDTLFIEGTGDPGLLHPYFQDSTALHFLKDYPLIALNLNNFKADHYGPGWAWEDYDGYYSPERSGFPMYGNVVTVYNRDSLTVSPPQFNENVIPIDYKRNRELEENIFYFNPNRKDTLTVPFKINDTLITKLLSEATQKQIHISTYTLDAAKQTLYGLPSDTLYQRMMYESDNFIAEQLLILAACTLSDTLDGSIARDHMVKNYLSDLAQPPKWVDGSGLSRYNLFSPESMVHVLTKMYEGIPRQRLFNLFPLSGASGTLKTWDNGIGEPYLYAKSGSLGNTYCLSGYLLTKSGKTLIFSFMNNHYQKPTAAVKARMQEILGMLRDEH
jgi:D-alanyl-D-alanine carboxypeptidase/D-alanyl-D-alanine-endopeptidase (penicillin-binding protein 4)